MKEGGKGVEREEGGREREREGERERERGGGWMREGERVALRKYFL